MPFSNLFCLNIVHHPNFFSGEHFIFICRHQTSLKKVEPLNNANACHVRFFVPSQRFFSSTHRAHEPSGSVRFRHATRDRCKQSTTEMPTLTKRGLHQRRAAFRDYQINKIFWLEIVSQLSCWFCKWFYICCLVIRHLVSAALRPGGRRRLRRLWRLYKWRS